MLVLTRKRNEVVTIGDNIRVTVVGLHHDRVQLGIEAPDDVAIHRQEVNERIIRGEPWRKHQRED